MGHTYYSDDILSRKVYFDKQFLVNAKRISRQNGISLNSFFLRIKDFESFKDALQMAWSVDASLLSYYDGMSELELFEFFERPVIQNVLNKDTEEIIEEIPLEVVQVEKKTREFFMGRRKDISTFGYKDFVKVKGKKQIRYRDSKGRFISVK